MVAGNHTEEFQAGRWQERAEKGHLNLAVRQPTPTPRPTWPGHCGGVDATVLEAVGEEERGAGGED